MQVGDRYVVYSQNTLYRLPSASCSEGDTVVLNNSNVERVFLVNGNFIEGDTYTTSGYNSTSYVCHVWQGSEALNYSDLILPATLIVLCFFYIIYKWFIRLRG